MSGELPCNGSLDLESDLKLADWLGDDLPAFLTDLVGEVLEDLWGEIYIIMFIVHNSFGLRSA